MNPLSNPPSSQYPLSTGLPVQEVPYKGEVDVEEESRKSHRRSKNDVEGRTYSCKHCDKSYLSYPALYTHCKQKHNTCNTSGRGRGRPKKETTDVSCMLFTFCS